MDKITAIHPPFRPENGTCSTKSPINFQWTTEKTDTVVYCDESIIPGIFETKTASKKIAWIVESPGIIPGVVDYIIANKKLVSYSYDAVFTCVIKIVGLEKNFLYNPSGSNLPWIKNVDYAVYHKTKLCSMFASNKQYTIGQKMRHQFAAIHHETVDIFGGAYGSKRMGEGVHPDKINGLRDYMFNVVIENVNEDKYYTEKITDCFATGTIPIYWGTSKIAEDFDERGIILLNDKFNINMLTKELYLSKLEYIKNNFKIVQSLASADELLYQKIRNL